MLKERSIQKNERQFVNRPLISGRDFGEILGILVFTPLCWLIPQKFWFLFLYPGNYFSKILFFRKRKENIRKIKMIMSSCLEIRDARKIEFMHSNNTIEQKVQYLRDKSPFGWAPPVQITGMDHVKKALNGGRGAVLFVGPFFFNNLLIKKCLFEGGTPISHLSMYGHGPCVSRFGIRFVNEYFTRVENKYLLNRIVIEPAVEKRYLSSQYKFSHIRRIEEELLKNRLVSISSEASPGQKSVYKKILNGKMPFATGGIGLAVSGGAPLIPVFTLQLPGKKIQLVFEKEIEVPLNGGRHEKIDMILDQYSKLVEKYLLKFPCSFRSWKYLGTE